MTIRPPIKRKLPYPQTPSVSEHIKGRRDEVFFAYGDVPFKRLQAIHIPSDIKLNISGSFELSYSNPVQQYVIVKAIQFVIKQSTLGEPVLWTHTSIRPQLFEHSDIDINTILGIGELPFKLPVPLLVAPNETITETFKTADTLSIFQMVLIGDIIELQSLPTHFNYRTLLVPIIVNKDVPSEGAEFEFNTRSKRKEDLIVVGINDNKRVYGYLHNGTFIPPVYYKFRFRETASDLHTFERYVLNTAVVGCGQLPYMPSLDEDVFRSVFEITKQDITKIEIVPVHPSSITKLSMTLVCIATNPRNESVKF